MPTKWRLFCLRAASRRRVSWKWALPPSMSMSPGSSSGANSSITASVAAPALTMMSKRLGFCRAATKSCAVWCGDEGALVAELVHGVGDAGGGPVVQGDGVAVAGEVAGQVTAHHAQPGDAYLRFASRPCAPRASRLGSRGRVFPGSLCHPGGLRCLRGCAARGLRCPGVTLPRWWTRTGFDWRALNRANWDDRVPVHLASSFYDLAGFRAGRDIPVSAGAAAGADDVLAAGVGAGGDLRVTP